MAVTSASSAELIAVSSIVTYDVYQTYINPQAKGARLIQVGHAACVLYAIVLAGFATGLYYAGVGMGYLYLLMGVIISSAVLPATLTLMWDKQNWQAAAFSPILGLAVSLIAWLTTTKSMYGEFTVKTTGSKYVLPHSFYERSTNLHVSAIPCLQATSRPSCRPSSSSQS